MNIIDQLGSNLQPKQLLQLARVAETAELYNDCFQFMSSLTKHKSAKNEDLDVNERNILSVAIKNIIGRVRASIRSLDEDNKEDYYISYKTLLKSELKQTCEQSIDLLTTYILPLITNNADETEVFYNKSLGDYYRYLAECFDDIIYKKNTEKYYEIAMDIAENNLNETHPTRLGLALNFSVFYNEILKQPEKACNLAKRAFDSSIEKLDTLNDASYKDSTLVMQLLRDNLTLWSGDDGMTTNDNETIGFAVGGARDVNNFRQCIEKNLIPKPGSITYNGLLYEYYFDTKSKKMTQIQDEIKDDGSMLFYPSYCYARINKLDFMNIEEKKNDIDECECYMTVGLNSNIKQKDFARKKLNLVIVLDKSGSMSDCFDDERQAYYAQFNDNGIGNNSAVRIKTKMEIANECIVALLKHLRPKDRFGLIVFDNKSTVYSELKLIENFDINKLKNDILKIKASGGTNFECGYNEAIKLYFDNNIKTDEEYDNRIIFLTDAQPNHGKTNPNSLMGLVDKYSNNKLNYVYSTFIGVGLDFNAKLIEEISNTRGCNYYSVQSTNDFNKVMNEDFEYMCTPLVFNVCLKIKSEGNSCCIDKVYGASNQMEKQIIKNGEITKINTLFPSKKSKSKGGTKGGIQLIKIKNDNDNKDMNVEIEVTFEDKYGKVYNNTQYISFKTDNSNKNDMIEDNNYYDNLGIRKGILLCKYGELLMNWIDNEYYNNNNNGNIQLNDKYKKIFSKFIAYFKNEMEQCNDNELQKELDLLNKLVNNE